MCVTCVSRLVSLAYLSEVLTSKTSGMCAKGDLREGLLWGIDAYCVTKTVLLHLTDTAKLSDDKY